MQIMQNQLGEKLILTIEGRIDTTTAPSLEEVVNNMSDSIKDLVLDMKNVEYVSSAGLRVLLSIQKKISKVGTLKLTGINDDVMEVFKMTGFADILTIE